MICPRGPSALAPVPSHRLACRDFLARVTKASSFQGFRHLGVGVARGQDYLARLGVTGGLPKNLGENVRLNVR